MCECRYYFEKPRKHRSKTVLRPRHRPTHAFISNALKEMIWWMTTQQIHKNKEDVPLQMCIAQHDTDSVCFREGKCSRFIISAPAVQNRLNPHTLNPSCNRPGEPTVIRGFRNTKGSHLATGLNG